MQQIIQGAVVNVTVTLKQSGVPFPIASGSSVSAQFTTVDCATVLINSITILESTPGSNWAAGTIVVPLTNSQTAGLPLGDVLMRVTVSNLTWLVPMEVVPIAAASNSALFPSRADTIAELRRDRLMLAASSVLPGVDLSDDYIWSKLMSAEAELQRELRVFFQPTNIIPDDASQDEVDAMVASGQPWAQESAQDYTPNFFHGERWGYLVTRSKPIISVSSVRFVYPTADNQVFEIPHAWIRMDKKYGHIRMVPTSMSMALPIGAFTLQAISGGMGVPFMIQIRYQAGLTNAAANWPDLVDVVKKKAVLGIISDSFLPQSGSISADGLSQSMSVDMEKYHDTIDRKINGGKGSNGGLMTAIHGIRLGVLGS